MENLLTRLSTINFSWRNLLFEVSSLIVKAKISLQYTDILWDYEYDHNAKYKYKHSYQCKFFLVRHFLYVLVQLNINTF